MSKKRYRPEEIIAKLRWADAWMAGKVGRGFHRQFGPVLDGMRLNGLQTPPKQQPFSGWKGVLPERCCRGKPVLFPDPV